VIAAFEPTLPQTSWRMEKDDAPPRCRVRSMSLSKPLSALILIASALLLGVVRNGALAQTSELPAARNSQNEEPKQDQAQTQKAPTPSAVLSNATASSQPSPTPRTENAAPNPQNWNDWFWQNFSALLIAVLAVWAGFIGLRTLNAIREQAKIARDTLTETSRPWVYPEIAIASALTYDVNGAKIAFQVVLKNTGHSVAKDVWPDLKLLLRIPKIKGGPTDEVAEQRKLSEEARKRNPEQRKLGFVIFPGAIAVINMTLVLSHTEIENAKIGDQGFISPCLIGCVDYRFTFGPPAEHHQTGFIYDLLNRQPYTPGMFAIQSGVEVPADQLQLGLSFMGGNYAD
jgi:hypothetical protein